jgi:hypothetical protein
MINNQIVRKILFVIGVIVMLALLSILFLFLSSFKKPQENKNNKKPVTQVDVITNLVIATDPPVTKQLEAGSIQTFTITLDPSIVAGEVKVTLSSSPPSDASAKSVVPTQITVTGQKITLTTSAPIEPYTTYTLFALYKGRSILSQAYLSTPPKATPIPSNNPTLASQLPYETLTYILTYNKERNIYEMHFKYDPNSSKDLTAQFNEAKTNVNSFITGKGIDVNTIKIDYLFK